MNVEEANDRVSRKGLDEFGRQDTFFGAQSLSDHPLPRQDLSLRTRLAVTLRTGQYAAFFQNFRTAAYFLSVYSEKIDTRRKFFVLSVC